MRIAIVTHRVGFQDGQGRVNFEIAMALLASGHSVTIIAEVCSEEIASHPRGRFIRVRNYGLPSQLLRDLNFAVKSGHWIEKHRQELDLVQANGFVMWAPADVVAIHYVHDAWFRNPSYPFHWSSLSPYAYYQRILTILNVHFEKHAFAQAKILIAVSNSTAAEVRSLGFPAEKLRVVYNGVDVEEFHPGTAQRDMFGLPDGVPMALFAGDIRTPRKNLDTTLRALRDLPGLHLVVAGKLEGSPYPRMAEELGLTKRVHFIGLTRQLPLLMRSVDLFVIPSRYETFGMVAVEAMISGLPVVLSSKVGAVEVSAATSYVLQDTEDVKGLSALLQEILQDPVQAHARGQAGRERALQLTWSNTTNGYAEVYRELMSRKPRRVRDESGV